MKKEKKKVISVSKSMPSIHVIDCEKGLDFFYTPETLEEGEEYLQRKRKEGLKVQVSTYAEQKYIEREGIQKKDALEREHTYVSVQLGVEVEKEKKGGLRYQEIKEGEEYAPLQQTYNHVYTYRGVEYTRTYALERQTKLGVLWVYCAWQTPWWQTKEGDYLESSLIQELVNRQESEKARLKVLDLHTLLNVCMKLKGEIKEPEIVELWLYTCVLPQGESLEIECTDSKYKVTKTKEGCVYTLDNVTVLLEFDGGPLHLEQKEGEYISVQVMLATERLRKRQFLKELACLQPEVSKGRKTRLQDITEKEKTEIPEEVRTKTVAELESRVRGLFLGLKFENPKQEKGVTQGLNAVLVHCLRQGVYPEYLKLTDKEGRGIELKPKESACEVTYLGEGYMPTGVLSVYQHKVSREGETYYRRFAQTECKESGVHLYIVGWLDNNWLNLKGLEKEKKEEKRKANRWNMLCYKEIFHQVGKLSQRKELTLALQCVLCRVAQGYSRVNIRLGELEVKATKQTKEGKVSILLQIKEGKQKSSMHIVNPDKPSFFVSILKEEASGEDRLADLADPTDLQVIDLQEEQKGLCVTSDFFDYLQAQIEKGVLKPTSSLSILQRHIERVIY